MSKTVDEILDEIAYLDDEALKELRGALASHRTAGAFEPNKWSVGSLNRQAKVLGRTPPKSVRIRDITLRCIEQVIGAGINDAERVRLAEVLAGAGIPEIQIGARMNGLGVKPEILKEMIRTAKAVNPNIVTSYIVNRKGDIDLASDVGVDAVHFGQTCMFGILRAFLYESVWQGKDWRQLKVVSSVEEQLGRWLNVIAYCRNKGVKIGAGINQVSYASEAYVEKIVSNLTKAGVDEINFYDSCHGLGPEAWRFLCSFAKKIEPNFVLGMHAHNDFNLGVAGSVAAALGGADVLEVSVNGVGGPGVGQPDLAETVASLEIVYGIDTGIRLGELTALSRLVDDVTRESQFHRKPVTGTDAWYFGGFDEMLWEYMVDPLLPTPVNPEVVGNELKLKGYASCVSGYWSMYVKLRSLGFEVDRATVPGILKAVKEEIRLRKRMLTDGEIAHLANDLLQGKK